MTFPDDEPRRPSPSTGRQDRHRAEAPATMPPEGGFEGAASLPPRGAAHYAEGRTRQIGLGCLVALCAAGALAAVVLLALGLAPSDEFVPAGGVPPGPGIAESPADGTFPAGNTPAGTDAAPGGGAPAEAE